MSTSGSHRLVYKKVVKHKLRAAWENKLSPFDVSPAVDDPLGIKGITAFAYDEVPLLALAEAAYTRDSAPRKRDKKGILPKEQYINKYLRRVAAKQASVILICYDYELIADTRQGRLRFEVIFAQPDDSFKITFLFDALPTVKDDLTIVPEHTSTENYEAIIKKYPHGRASIGILLRLMANEICPRLHAHFPIQV
jgi:hypothetical protein